MKAGLALDLIVGGVGSGSLGERCSVWWRLSGEKMWVKRNWATVLYAGVGVVRIRRTRMALISHASGILA